VTKPSKIWVIDSSQYKRLIIGYADSKKLYRERLKHSFEKHSNKYWLTNIFCVNLIYFTKGWFISIHFM
jgi:hypothetical protein